MHLNPKIVSLALTYHVLGAFGGLDGHCPPLGPVLPAPTRPSADPAVQSAIAAFIALMEERSQSDNSTAFALGVKSTHEDEPLLEWAFTPPEEFRDPSGVQEVDSDTVFRLASLSKVFPVLGVLMVNNVSWEDPVTKYIPELRALNEQARAQTPVWTTDWDSVTIGALASHMGGIAVDMSTDIAEFADLEDYGFPPRDQYRLMNCSGLLNTPECDRSIFFERFGERAPVELVFSPNPVYSNIGFTLLGFVVEAVTNRPFQEFLEDEIFSLIGMTHSFATKPDDSLGYIPLNDLWWNSTLGYEAPAGAYYSSITDLLALGNAILSHNLLPAPTTRAWFKPVTSTSSSGVLIGRPWEIFRTQNVTVDGRLIELYTKGGDISTYHSILAFIPDYDLVASILISGPSTDGFAVLSIFSQLVQTLLPGLEAAGKNENEVVHAGTYTDRETNSTITLSLDDSPGFEISPWVVRSVDVLTTSQGLNLPPVPFPPPPVDAPARFRLYTTDAHSDNQTSWRAIAALGTAEEIAELERGLVWDMPLCVTWGAPDRLTYMLQSQDHFVFTVEEGRAVSVELVGYGVVLTRED